MAKCKYYIEFVLQQNLIMQKAYNHFNYVLRLIQGQFHERVLIRGCRCIVRRFINFGQGGVVQSLVQWCLINHFLLIRKRMYRQDNISFQPYYIIQAPNNLYSPFMFQDSLPFMLQPFLLHNQYQNTISQTFNAPTAIEVPLSAASTLGQQTGALKTPLEDQNLQKANIIKEKIIKKLANRPATYLTEKKYYLAQTLIEDSNSNRKLRPRNLKKKHHKTHEKTTMHKQTCFQGKGQDLSTKDDKGINSFQQQYQEKKLEQKQDLNVEKTMNSIDSSVSQGKK